MQNLIKLSDTHYIVVNDSEIEEGEKFAHYWYKDEFSNNIEDKTKVIISTATKDTNYKQNRKSYIGKITHSTQPLEKITFCNCYYIKYCKSNRLAEGIECRDGKDENNKEYKIISSLSLSEVEEAINGYSVEKLYYSKFTGGDSVLFPMGKGHKKNWIEGFKAHQELVKDKLFTDLENKIKTAKEYWSKFEGEKQQGINYGLGLALEFIKQTQPKTEWEVTFDEQGKLKIL